MGHIVELERRYNNQYGSLFHNLAYRETSAVFVLQQTIEPTIVSVPGLHGVDAECIDRKSIEIKSTNLSVPVYMNSKSIRFKGALGAGHRLDHSNLVGKFDKMHSDERFARVMDYNAYIFSIFANKHLPEVVFYIKESSGVEKIKTMLKEEREKILKFSDTSSFKGTIIDIKYVDVFEKLTDKELNILVDHSYLDPSNDMIKYTQIDKDQYNQVLIGSEMPKGNFKRKKTKY